MPRTVPLINLDNVVQDTVACTIHWNEVILKLTIIAPTTNSFECHLVTALSFFIQKVDTTNHRNTKLWANRICHYTSFDKNKQTPWDTQDLRE